MSQDKCFICTSEIQNGVSTSDNSSSEENCSFLLCQILELSNLGERRINYCRLCLNKILNIRDMLEELERIEKKVLDEKYTIELQLKEKDLKNKSQQQGQSSSDQFTGEIVTELRAASVKSMLDKIRKNSLGQRRINQSSRHIRIMKNVTIPKILCETVQPISRDQLPNRNIMFTLQESQPQLILHQHSFLPNPQSGSTRNNDLESQGEDKTSEEPLTGNAIMTDKSWISDNEECDIKYEIPTDSDVAMAIDPLQPENLDHLDFSQHHELTGQISTKLEVDDLREVTEFSDAQKTIASDTEDPPSVKNFICGTCGAGFVSYNQLRMHDQMHLKVANYKSSRSKNINRKKGKSGRNTKNTIPCLRPKKCKECGKVLSSRRTWTYHVMTFHRRQYNFKCTQCNYGCQKSCDLKKHVRRVHSVSIEDLKCSNCDRVYSSRRACSHHMRKCTVVQQ